MRVSFLKRLFVLAQAYRFLMPFAIWLSKLYIEAWYGKVLRLEAQDPQRSDELRRLMKLRRTLQPPTEQYQVDIYIENMPVRANLCQEYCGNIYYGVGFEQSELALAREFIADNNTIFDVGANIGVYTLLASQLIGKGGRVHSFEPLPDVNTLLHFNVSRNHCKNVTVNQVAVGDQNGVVQIFINAQNALSSLGNTHRGNVVDIKTVKMLTLDSYAESVGISRVDFLKIDVEGFEGHVLRGAAKLLDASPDLIVMSELAKKNFAPLGFSIDETLNWMRARGFEIWMVGDHSLELHPTFSIKNEYPFQNFLFIRPSNPKYHLVKKYSVSS